MVQFNDATLTRVFRQSTQKFDDYQQHLDAISNDIRQLDNHLNQYGIRNVFSYATPLVELCWMQVDGSQLWKVHVLMGETRFQKMKEFHQQYRFFKKLSSFETRPLISAPMAIRVAVRQYLPDFVQAFANHTQTCSDDLEEL